MIILTDIYHLLRGALFALPFLLLNGCWHEDGPCRDDVRSNSESPDGEYVAETVIRNCGATTGYVTHVRVFEFGTQVKREGPFVASINAFVDLEVEWTGPARIVVRAPEGVKYFRRTTEFENVQIGYETISFERGAHPL